MLPYLLGDRLVARVDVAANRAAGVLSVPGAWLEEPPARGRIGAGDVARALAADLRAMAQWLGLDDVVVGERGDLTAALRALGRW